MALRQFNISGGCTDVCFSVLGKIQTNVYVVSDGAGGVIVVDPEDDANAILEMAARQPVSAIFVTHKHLDHIGALAALAQATGAPVYASAVDAPDIESPAPNRFGLTAAGCPVDVRLADNDMISVGATTWQVLATPGHTPGSICFFLDPTLSSKPDAEPILLSGDTLFCAAIGRTDFEGGSMEQMACSLKKLATLPDETIVLPGHDAPTTIGDERVRTLEYYSNQ